MYVDNKGRLVASDELYHHGILGQRYGQQNGPPYPLLATAHSTSEKKAGWVQSLSAAGRAARKDQMGFADMYRASMQLKYEQAVQAKKDKEAKAAEEAAKAKKTATTAKTTTTQATEDTKKENKKSTKDSSVSSGKSSSSKGSSGSSGKTYNDEENLAKLRDEVKSALKDLEDYGESLTSSSSNSSNQNSDELTSGSDLSKKTDEKKESNVRKATAEESINDRVNTDKFNDFIDKMYDDKKENDSDTIAAILEEIHDKKLDLEMLKNKSDNNSFDTEEENYLMELVVNRLNELKKKKAQIEDLGSIEHSYSLAISNRGTLVAYQEVSDYELYHHQIRGAEWGVRNGPPYPLSREAHSVSEKKAGWTKSLKNIAKATGKGVARAAKGTEKAVYATGKGTRKALIKINLFPKKFMSNQEILDKVERLKTEDLLKHAKGKLTNEQKAEMKLKDKDAMREVAKESLKQLIPAIGKDLVISQIKNKLDLKFDLEKTAKKDIYKDAIEAGKTAAEALELAKTMAKVTPKTKTTEEEKERAKKVWNDIYEDAKAAGKSASEARDIANTGKSDIPSRRKDEDGGNGKGGFNPKSEAQRRIFNQLADEGVSYKEAAERAKAMDDTVAKKSKGGSDQQSSGSNKQKGENQQPQQKQQNGENQQPQQKQQKQTNNNDALEAYISKKGVEAATKRYDKAVAEGATHEEAAKAARSGQDYVSKASKEAAAAESKQRAAEQKAKEKAGEKAQIKAETALEKKRKAAESKQKKLIESKLIEKEKAKVEKAIEKSSEIFTYVDNVKNGSIDFIDDKGNQGSMNYIDNARSKVNEYLKKIGKG